MPQAIFRMGKRRTSWEQSRAEFAQIEFQKKSGGFDLRPSVYVVEVVSDDAKHASAVQLRAEHGVSFLSPPSKAGTIEVDVHQLFLRPLKQSPATTQFSFANNGHAEIEFEHDQQLLDFAATVHAQQRGRFLRDPFTEHVVRLEANQNEQRPQKRKHAIMSRC